MNAFFLLQLTKNTFLLLALVVITFVTYAQERTKKFLVDPPPAPVQQSLYRTIDFLDSRADTTDLGSVQKGVLNAPARVIADPPLGSQLANTLDALTDSTAEAGKLLFQLRHLQFAELTGAFSENGYCYMRASLYANRDDCYIPLATVDTVVSVSSMEVTNALLRRTGNTMVDFIASQLLHQPDNKSGYPLALLVAMDSLEKRNIPLYTTEVYTDGLYRTYDSFAAQIPDNQPEQLVIREKDGSVSRVKLTVDLGKPKKVKPKDVYALVHQGRPYIATSFGYYPLRHEGDDLMFIGKAKVTAAAGDVIAASVFFGIAGAVIASHAEATFVMKIDHLNGGFIRLREMPDTYRN